MAELDYVVDELLEPPAVLPSSLLLPQAAAPSMSVAAATAEKAIRGFMVICSLIEVEDFMRP